MSAIEIILCLPHNQYRFKYKFNDGSFHFIDKEKAMSFFKDYLGDNMPDIKKLYEALVTFSPFIILPKNNKLFILSKQEETDFSYFQNLQLSQQELHNIKEKLDSLQIVEKIPNDNFLSNFQKKIEKFEKNRKI